MENMIKDRIVKKMIVTWSITIIILAVLGWIIIKLFGFPDVNFASADIFDWCLVVLFFVILIYSIIGTVNSLRYRKILNEFYIMNNMSKKAVEEELAKATELIEGYWVTPVLTVYYDGNKFGIVKNAKLSKVNISITRTSHGVQVFYLELYNRERDRIAKLHVDHNYTKILDYYRENCPHIALL